jgi:hypothetical protein
MEVANTLAYYDTATITAVKSFIVQALGSRTIKHYEFIIYGKLTHKHNNLNKHTSLQWSLYITNP